MYTSASNLEHLPYTVTHLHIIQNVANYLDSNPGLKATVGMYDDQGGVSIKTLYISEDPKYLPDEFQAICELHDIENWLDNYQGPTPQEITWH